METLVHLVVYFQVLQDLQIGSHEMSVWKRETETVMSEGERRWFHRVTSRSSQHVKAARSIRLNCVWRWERKEGRAGEGGREAEGGRHRHLVSRAVSGRGKRAAHRWGGLSDAAQPTCWSSLRDAAVPVPALIVDLTGGGGIKDDQPEHGS